MVGTTYITKLYDRLDKIAFDRYGTTDGDLVNFIIDQNPGLERQDFLLEPGLTINLPDLPASMTATIETAPGQIFLWS
ncbi:tail protein X [Methylobacterium oxalidis]|uniref:Tail protein X n=1 Tax=Methylobacterium oxalidis TaxID=944322 RepID=A0A512IX42_9HYPH|nr:tail protein X [Methylobacterium oxalidis]GEP02281.1 hypothetical protein MOX02_03190 [Methylobacterium oxalidis]GJE32271.1 hypothetical protein LDDCCGHA_2457 [Methylobacterium oxalidis]GLS62226.1 hypothetical protein GCM10007888_06070 [Methylobacterium oxalidis]